MKFKEKQNRFMTLFEPLSSRLERFALTMTMNREEAKDVVGETVMIAFENFAKLESEQAFLSYLFTIASRVYNKRQRTFFKFKVNEKQELDDLYCNSLSPDVSTDVSILYKALEKLPVKQKEALVLFEVMGFSLKEICEIQNSKLSSVKMRLKRARQNTAEMLGVNDYGLDENKNSKISELSNEKGQYHE